MAGKTRVPKSVTIPGYQPTPSPVTARPVTVPNKKTMKKPPVPKKDKAAKTYKETLISVIIDKSGSMLDKAGDVIGGYNTYTDDRKKDPTAATTKFSMTLFDTIVTKVHNAVPIADVPPLNTTTYRPDGWTALLDAIGMTVSDLDKAVTEDSRVLVVIMTDGMENSSKEYRRETIRQMITSREAKGNWTFVFMGADMNAFAESATLGINAGSTFSYDSADTGAAMKRLNVSTQSYMVSASVGNASKTFFTPDTTTDK